MSKLTIMTSDIPSASIIFFICLRNDISILIDQDWNELPEIDYYFVANK